MIGTPEIVAFFDAYLAEIEARQSTLDRLDAVAGDGDHGATMVMGMREVVAALPPGSKEKPREALRIAAEAFGSVGGSIGPLWGTALVRAARGAGDEDAIADDLLPEMILAAVVGLQERGRSRVGDKTLLDVMHPAADAFAHTIRAGRPATAALERAIEAAQAGLRGTAGIPARRGRARRLAERSVGSVDPGAASACLAWETAGNLAGVAVEAATENGT